MALEDIFAALEEQADKEIEEILQDARDQAEGITERAAEEAESIRTMKVDQADRATRLEASQSVNAAKLEGKKRTAAVKERAVGEAFDKALEMLSNVRGSNDYPAMFRVLVEEALQGMVGDVDVLVDPADADVARSTIASLGVDAEVKTDLTTVGGLVAATKGGRIKRRNTFEDRLDKVRQSARADVAEILFS